MNPVERVKNALAESRLDANLVRELPADTSTAEAAARAVGAPQGSIVKSLIFLADGAPLLVLVSGDQRADIKRLRATLGLSKRRLRIARPAEVLKQTGFVVGGVPPVGHWEPLRTLIDGCLSRFDTVWAAAGRAPQGAETRARAVTTVGRRAVLGIRLGNIRLFLFRPG